MLLKLINQLIAEKHYDGIDILLQESRNLSDLRANAPEYVELCRQHLTDENYNMEPNLYNACESLLKSVAKNAVITEVLFELLELIDSAKSDNVFTSALKALQVCLLRPESDRKSLEWGLNEVLSHISELNYPTYLSKGYDDKERALLEQNDEIHRILINHITIKLFYEPILTENILVYNKYDVFRSTKWEKTTVFASFLLQLLARPLALLDLSHNEKHKTNIHSTQCARQITTDLCKIFKNPFYLLDFVEPRCRFKKANSKDDMYRPLSKVIYMNDEKFPLLNIGVFYYLVIAEELLPNDAPLIYNPLFVFETCLYLVNKLIREEEMSLQQKGIALCNKTISNLEGLKIPCSVLELRVNADFCEQLIKIVIYSEHESIRKQGINLLKKYILQFDLEGQNIVLKKLMQTTKHSGLLGYLMTLYKNIVSQQLDSNNELEIFCTKHEFKYFLLNICSKLESGPSTDIIQASDQIVSALNIIRYFAQRDKNNITGFWSFVDTIQKEFLDPLRNALNLSRAHYKAEEYRVQNDIKIEGENELFDKFLINNEILPSFDKNQKLIILNNAIVTFDLIESLLARVNECLDNKK